MRDCGLAARMVPTLALLCSYWLPALAAGAADWSEQQLATAGALRDRALSGTSAYDHVSSLVTEVGPRSAGSTRRRGGRALGA